MKKSLLLLLATAAGICSASAAIKTPELYHDTNIQRISADGRYAVSEVYGTLKIIDLVDGVETTYEPDDDWVEYYSLGLGNCITSDGSIVLASTQSLYNAAYWEGDEWHLLDVPDPNLTNLSNGITPDGSRICGSIGLVDMTLEEQTMQVPAYWDRKADGSGYSEYHLLPHPDKDLFGEVPTYITAVCISEDGKTILGQMQFSRGSICIPLVYTEGADGEWSYSMPTKDLFNPDHLEPVENPGDGPEPPFYEDYMTPEEIAAYYEACMNYDYDSGDPYPEFDDFMTPENKTAYNAALDEYYRARDEWSVKYDAFDEYYNAVRVSSPNFMFNNCIFSSDGKYIVSTLESDDPNADPWAWFPSSLYTPVTVNIATGEMERIDTDLSLVVSGTAYNGIILAHNGQQSNPTVAYVIKDGEVQTLTDYLGAISPEYVDWIDENMTHEVAVDYDPETWEEIFEELTFTGIPTATPDLSVIAAWNSSPWDNWEIAQSVVFFTPGITGIRNVSADIKNIKVLASGVIAVPEGFRALDIYDVNGCRVESIGSPCGTVRLHVAGGVYVAKATRTDGTVSVVKIVCN